MWYVAVLVICLPLTRLMGFSGTEGTHDAASFVRWLCLVYIELCLTPPSVYAVHIRYVTIRTRRW